MFKTSISTGIWPEEQLLLYQQKGFKVFETSSAFSQRNSYKIIKIIHRWVKKTRQ